MSAESAAITSTRWAGTSFIHVECATVEIGTIQTGDGLLCLVRSRHFDEGEATGLPAIAIRHYVHTLHIPELGKRSVQVLLRCLEAEVPDINVCHQVSFHIVFIRSNRVSSKGKRQKNLCTDVLALCFMISRVAAMRF